MSTCSLVGEVSIAACSEKSFSVLQNKPENIVLWTELHPQKAMYRSPKFCISDDQFINKSPHTLSSCFCGDALENWKWFSSGWCGLISQWLNSSEAISFSHMHRKWKNLNIYNEVNEVVHVKKKPLQCHLETYTIKKLLEIWHYFKS